MVAVRLPQRRLEVRELASRMFEGMPAPPKRMMRIGAAQRRFEKIRIGEFFHRLNTGEMSKRSRAHLPFATTYLRAEDTRFERRPTTGSKMISRIDQSRNGDFISRPASGES